ncbi:hypothetical protein ACFYNY_20705 [Streptomyces sp. NPDC006530]|uniref:hypothetical protein n=1 Tax=Streptomyces sp. NPDC006530 TaxID=3364750 RepID=UPI0036974BD0
MAMLRDWGLALGRRAGRPVARVQKDSGDPEVGRIRTAAASGDWNTVRDILQARPESDDWTELVRAVGDTAGVERWISGVLEAEPDAPLPRLVAGFRYIGWAWEARTGARASHVSREQFEVFHSRLRSAEEWLYEAAEREPGWTTPWLGLVTTGRGLQVGQDAARRRFEAAVRRGPHHLAVHQQRLQQVCAKWSGSHEQMHSFAREAALGAPGGTLLGQLVAMAHIEHWLDLDSGPDSAYIRSSETVASLREAAEHSYRHPDFVRSGEWLQVYNTFAMAFSLAGDHAAARECFAASEGRVTESPWQYLNGADPAAAYKEHRAAARH